MKTPVRKKGANSIDVYVGARVRMRRLVMGISQEKLGDALNLTFQQVQKYEKGMNRIGASRLQQIADVLEVPVSFFFEGVPHEGRNVGGMSEPAAPSYVTGFLATSDGLALAQAFTRIKSPKLRRSVVHLVETLTQK